MVCYIYTKDVDHFQPETSTLNFCPCNSNLFLPKIIAKHCSLKTRARSCLGPWCRPGILRVSLIFQIPMSFWKKSAPSLSSWDATKRSSTYTKTRGWILSGWKFETACFRTSLVHPLPTPFSGAPKTKVRVPFANRSLPCTTRQWPSNHQWSCWEA